MLARPLQQLLRSHTTAAAAARRGLLPRPWMTMATAAEVREALAALLPDVNLETTTERKLRERLASQLGPIDEHKALIKQEIDRFLSQPEPDWAPTLGDSGIQPSDLGGADPAAGSKRKRAPAGAGAGAGAASKVPRAAAAAAAPAGAADAGGPGRVRLGSEGHKYLSVETFKGAKRVDLRTFFQNRETGELAPTKSVVSFTMKEWSALLALLPALQQAADAQAEDFAADLPNGLRATTGTFSGNFTVGIREYYRDDAGEVKPGKRGINLSPEQFASLLEHLPAVNEQLPAAATEPAAPAGAAAAAAAPAPAPAGAAAGGGGQALGGALELGGRKRAAVSTYGATAACPRRLDLREMYERDGELLPGKKGIMLTPEQWGKLTAAAGDVTSALEGRDATFSLDLGSKRLVTVSEFKKTWYVGVREHYEKDGKLQPGQKGLSMTAPQWQKLVAGMTVLTNELHGGGG